MAPNKLGAKNPLREYQIMDSNTSVVPVSDKRGQKQFIRFAWDHYRGDKNWVPPLRMEIKELLNYKKHPFYDNAEIQTFLARRGDTVVGRIAAIVDHGHNQTHNEKRGMFGFYECINDVEVSNSAVRRCQVLVFPTRYPPDAGAAESRR